ncbi:hypothetical protein EAH_00067320, partial [Eimeria acervulina]
MKRKARHLPAFAIERIPGPMCFSSKFSSLKDGTGDVSAP